MNYPTISLQPGSTDVASVKQLQDYLVSKGLMTQEQVNTGYGTYGPQTTAAVLALQKSLGIDYSSGPGYWGPKTLAALAATPATPPVLPITPTGPVLPLVPKTPTTPAPVTPAVTPPVTPVAPPATPVVPTTPTTPATPVTPTTPTTPVTPTAPVVNPEDIQAQLADLKNKLATAQTELEKENARTDFVKAASAAGVSYTDITKYLATLEPATESEADRKKAIYEKYGITGLEEKAFATPTETFESIYKRAYQDAGLSDLVSKLQGISDEIAKVDDTYNQHIGDINKDVWLPEGSRSARVKRESDTYEMKRTRLDAEYTRVSNELERGKQRAESVATNALSEIEKGATRTKEELAYYVNRANADLAAELTTAKQEGEKELLRYFPEFVGALPAPKEDTSGWQLKQNDSGEWVWTHPTKGEKPSGIMGKNTLISQATLNKLSAGGVPNAEAIDIQNAFNEGYTKDQIKAALTKVGKDPKLVDTFTDIVAKIIAQEAPWTE